MLEYELRNNNDQEQIKHLQTLNIPRTRKPTNRGQSSKEQIDQTRTEASV